MPAPGLRVSLGIFDRGVDRHRVMVYAPHAFHNVQFLAVWMAVVIEPGFIVESDGVNDERISLPLSDRIAHPCGRQILGMLPAVREDLADEVMVLKQHDHLARALQDFHWLASYQINAWHAGRKTVDDRVIRFRQSN